MNNSFFFILLQIYLYYFVKKLNFCCIVNKIYIYIVILFLIHIDNRVKKSNFCCLVNNIYDKSYFKIIKYIFRIKN